MLLVITFGLATDSLLVNTQVKLSPELKFVFRIIIVESFMLKLGVNTLLFFFHTYVGALPAKVVVALRIIDSEDVALTHKLVILKSLLMLTVGVTESASAVLFVGK